MHKIQHSKTSGRAVVALLFISAVLLILSNSFS